MCFVRFASIFCVLFLTGTVRSHENAPHEGEATQIKVFSLSNSSAEQLMDVIDTIFGEERFRIAADKRTNSVIVKARPDVLSAVEAVMLRLDESSNPKPNQKRIAKPKIPSKLRIAQPPAVVQPGHIVQPRDVVEIHSEVRGTTVIRSIVPAGAKVAKGDLLVQLDDSKLIAGAETVRNEIEMLKAEIMMTQQHGHVHDTSEVNLLEAALKLSQLRREHFEAEWKLEQFAAKGELAIAGAALKHAESEHELSEQRANAGQGSSVDVEGAGVEVTKAMVEYELAMSRQKLLDNTRRLRLAELDLETLQEELSLVRARRQTEAQMVQTKTKLQMLETKLRLKRNELARLKRQIKMCKILAPVAGMVRYPGPRGKAGEGISKEGASVREGQRLVLLHK
jgi:multidrug efflux pump subunit AcrA (membrane-fusion protein)